MAYIGNRPEQGNFRKCDAITTSATATYNLLVGGVAVNPNQNQCIVSLNGVIQSSGNSYTIASSQITFASTLASSDVIDFILILGDTLDVGTVSDDTIGLAQLSATGTPSSSNYLRGDNSWATAGGDLSFGGDTFGADKTIGSNDAYALSIETNNAVGLKIDNAGHITKPLQSACLVQKSANQNVDSTSLTVVTYDTEKFDQNADYGSNTFTAPVTGKYLLTYCVDTFNAHSGGYLRVDLVTSNTTFQQYGTIDTGSNEYFSREFSAVCDMDASDTAQVKVLHSNDTSWGVSGGSATATTFSACLLA